MHKLAITLAVLTTLVLAASAWAVVPSNGPFAGKTGVPSINGFPDVISLNVTGGGKFMKKFTFGTLGCFGHGSYPVGVDPYGDPTNTVIIASVPVTKGTFKYTTKPKLPEADGTLTTVTVQGSFTSTKAVSGTILVSQSDNGDTCGPSKMKFSATPGTPQSLGLD